MLKLLTNTESDYICVKNFHNELKFKYLRDTTRKLLCLEVAFKRCEPIKTPH